MPKKGKGIPPSPKVPRVKTSSITRKTRANTKRMKKFGGRG